MARTDEIEELLDALAVTAELTGTELSKPAARVMVNDLCAYPHAQVLASLARCRRELKGRLTLAAIIERLDDGRPSPNEAWAMIPQDEDGSVVWTGEMSRAFGVAAPLLREGQHVAARMAFLETYERLVATARAERQPPHWTPSLGHDPGGRAAALQDAATRGRLTREHVAGLLPGPDRESAIASANLLTDARPQAGRTPPPPAIAEQLRRFLSPEKRRRIGMRAVNGADDKGPE